MGVTAVNGDGGWTVTVMALMENGDDGSAEHRNDKKKKKKTKKTEPFWRSKGDRDVYTRTSTHEQRRGYTDNGSRHEHNIR